MVMEGKDYIQRPKPNGYRSLHMIIRVPVYIMDKKQLIPVELQLRTMAMDLWASLEHDIKYKSFGQKSDHHFEERLRECSHLIYMAEEEMEQMNGILESE